MKDSTVLIDATDWHILEILQQNARATFTDIGQAVGLTSPAVKERIRRMEDGGLIISYRPVINYCAIGRQIRSLVSLKFKSSARLAEKDEFSHLGLLKEIPGIVRAWMVTGDTEGVVETAVPSMKDLDEILIKLNKMGFLTVTYMILDDTGEMFCRPIKEQ